MGHASSALCCCAQPGPRSWWQGRPGTDHSKLSKGCRCQLPASVSPRHSHIPVLPQCLCFHLPLSQSKRAVPGFALGACSNRDLSKPRTRCGTSSVPHFSLPSALQFCAPMANPNALLLLTLLPAAKRALMQDLQQLERCWASASRSAGASAMPALGSLPW